MSKTYFNTQVRLNNGVMVRARAVTFECAEAGFCGCGFCHGEGQCEFGSCHNQLPDSKKYKVGTLCVQCSAGPSGVWRGKLPGHRRSVPLT